MDLGKASLHHMCAKRTKCIHSSVTVIVLKSKNGQEAKLSSRCTLVSPFLTTRSGMVEAEADDNQHWVRRSVRAAGASALDYPHVAKLLEQIRCEAALVARALCLDSLLLCRRDVYLLALH